ncbi:murein biosynthesis integral membrane protein MurJ [Ktedonosporobacter rubrisoli]|uniref:Probable lipid II flippase MurJ n=1 Tax=Ktedonosporobacter rubrisoli TaxID=2509675 RepID=A0A4P6K262_KTERU|nr:murein biosynthesis integral membrane protein MurJ [Ktedonosporobacter rubrisoli]QBD81790.1 murein biosynthesis integral membrane protein MurJ [Ktedonosporobacter rubrisoli]
MIGGACISHEPQHSRDTLPALNVATDAVRARTVKSTSANLKKRLLALYKTRGGRTFRFNLTNFRLGAGFTQRRFSITEAAFLLMVAIITSHGLGVIRQVIFNALFGTGPQANAYYAAAQLPDMLYYLICGGTLTHAFIPVFLSYQNNKGAAETWRLTSLIFNVILLAMTILVLAGEFLAPAYVSHILVPGYTPAEQELTTRLTRILLLQPLILGLGTVATSILNSKRQFLLPALAIAIYDIGVILGLLVALLVPGVGIYGPTCGILVAACMQVGVQIPGVAKQGARYSFVWDIRHPGLRQILYLLIPSSIAVAIGYVGVNIETAFASYLPDHASLSALRNAQMLRGLPLALMSQAIGQALLPSISAQASSGQYVRMRQTAFKVMGVSLLLTIPAVLILDFVGRPLIHILFQHGAFNSHSSALTNLAMIAYLVGLPGLVMVELLGRAYYALQDATTPLLTGIFSIAARYGLIAWLVHSMATPYVIMSIPLAISIAATVEAVFLFAILLLRLRKKVKLDKGMQRLLRRRARKNVKMQEQPATT